MLSLVVIYNNHLAKFYLLAISDIGFTSLFNVVMVPATIYIVILFVHTLGSFFFIDIDSSNQILFFNSDGIVSC